jgi:hypothetical protein
MEPDERKGKREKEKGKGKIKNGKSCRQVALLSAEGKS